MSLPPPRPNNSDGTEKRGARRNLFAGVGYLHAGIRTFYRDSSLWSYAAWPMAVVLVFYLLFMSLLVMVGIPYLIGLLPDPDAWNAWLRWIIYTARVLIFVSMTIMAFLAGTFFLCSFYEAAGALFFDRLVARFEEKRYGIKYKPVPFLKTLVFFAASAVFSLVTMGLNLVLFIPAFFFPLVGLVPAVLIVGYRFGLTYVFSSAFADGRGVGEVKKLAARNRALMIGFGSASYLWLLIPFSAVFLLPGFALGGAMIYRERLAPEK